MTRTDFLIPLALLGLSGTAFAGIDDIAAPMLDTVAAEVGTDDVQSRTTTTQSRSNGSKSQTRQKSSNNSGSKQLRSKSSSNGNQTRSHAQGRARSESSSSTHYSNGDRSHRQDTSVKVRETQSRSNGTKSVSHARGANIERSQNQGVANGQHYRGASTSVNARSQSVGHNNQNGRTVAVSSQTRGNQSVTRSGGRPATGSRSVTRTTTQSTTRPGARPAMPGRSPVVTHPGRPATARPGTTRPVTGVRPSGARPTTVVRPSGTRVVHTSSRPSRAVVHSYARGRTVRYTQVRPYHGVFVYGPRPVTHNHYSSGPAQVSQKHMPDRTIDRDNSVAVGLKMGALGSGYHDGGGYSDLGVGLAGRYRPAESVGLQLDVTHHAQSWAADTDRSQTMAAGSVQLFAFPWSRVSPYALGGVTYNARNIQDDIYQGSGSATVLAKDSLWGLHGGLGLELALGQSVALDIEGRYIGFLDRSPTDPSLPVAVQVTGGLMVHF